MYWESTGISWQGETHTRKRYIRTNILFISKVESQPQTYIIKAHEYTSHGLGARILLNYNISGRLSVLCLYLLLKKTCCAGLTTVISCSFRFTEIHRQVCGPCSIMSSIHYVVDGSYCNAYCRGWERLGMALSVPHTMTSC